ncbi:hypothetical protein J3459_011926 [Metarhizium acridum]|nr:hypothetical protein J3459_011926 [Metarhizium acridum]
MVVESMKMEINIFASVEGVFKPMVSEGDAINEGKAFDLSCTVGEIPTKPEGIVDAYELSP